MKYKIVIPSYNRATTLANKTLKLLAEYQIPIELINIFVANNEELEIYKNTISQLYHSRLIVGVKGMKEIRNFISNYFQKGEKLVHIDDDVTFIKYRIDKNNLEPLYCLDQFIKSAFELCKDKNSNLFSIYSVDNPYFMKNTVFIGATYCLGGFFGTINQQIDVTVNNKEDFERSIQYFPVIRFNNLCLGTTGYSGAGGMQSFKRTNDVIKEDASKVIELYPTKCKFNNSKKSDKPEIKIIRVKLEEIDLD